MTMMLQSGAHRYGYFVTLAVVDKQPIAYNEVSFKLLLNWCSRWST